MGVAEAGAIVRPPVSQELGRSRAGVGRLAAQPHPLVQRVELAVAPLHDVPAPAAQHFHSEHLAGAGGRPGAREAQREGSTGPAAATRPPSRAQRHKAPWEPRQSPGTLPRCPHTWGDGEDAPAPLLRAVPREPGRSSTELPNPSGRDPWLAVSGPPDPPRSDAPARARDPHYAWRGEMRRVPCPFPGSVPTHHVAFLWALPGILGSHRRDVNFQHPHPGSSPSEREAASKTSPSSHRRPQRAGPGPAPSVRPRPKLAPPRAFPRCAGSCEGLIRQRAEEAGAKHRPLCLVGRRSGLFVGQLSIVNIY